MLRGADPGTAPSRTLSPRAVVANTMPTAQSHLTATAMVISPDADRARFAPRHGPISPQRREIFLPGPNNISDFTCFRVCGTCARVSRNMPAERADLGLVESGIVK